MSIEQAQTPKADLVLEGGGVKGLGLVGAVTALAARGYGFPRIAGTSAGAIVGSLIAACTATDTPLERLVGIMQTVDYEKFRDATALDHLGVPGEAIELLIGRGIYKGDYLVEWLDNELRTIGVETFADLSIDEADDPGTSLPANQRYRLVVLASDISTGQLVRFPWDLHEHYGIDPATFRIADAVRASMAIPFFFKPFELHGDGRTVTLVDGGMLSNFPIECFDRTDGAPPRWPTFGVKLSARPTARQRPRPTDNTFELALACLQTLLGAHDAYHLEDDQVTQRTIFVDTLGVDATDFGIDAAVQQRLFGNGQGAADWFLDTWPPPGFTADGAWRGDAGDPHPARR